MTLRSGAPEILLVEDNPADIRLAQEVLHECDIRNHVSVARDGDEALHLLGTDGAVSQHAYRPDLIILDLNLPRKNGRDVLRQIKTDSSLRCIPVIVLTTSSNETDVRDAYALHANCYIVKPVDLEEFFEVVRRVETFWLGIVRLPGDAP